MNDLKEIVDYIDASNNVIELQAAKIADLEKTSSEKDAVIKRFELNKVAQSEQNEAGPTWGSGEKQINKKSNMRESERILQARFGL